MSEFGGSPVYDAFDVDLVVKVLAHTAFSECHHAGISGSQLLRRPEGPFFTFFIPVFYYFHGARWPEPIIVIPVVYNIAISAFCEYQAVLVQVRELNVVQGSSSGILGCTVTREAYSLALVGLTGASRLWS